MTSMKAELCLFIVFIVGYHCHYSRKQVNRKVISTLSKVNICDIKIGLLKQYLT